MLRRRIMALMKARPGSWARLRLSGRSTLLAAMLIAGCGGGGGDSTPIPPPPDLSGVWAGPWQGTDAVLGPVSGRWEATISQNASSAGGPTLLLGDVDCMDGVMDAARNAQGSLSGTLTRPPCEANSWSLNALNVDMGSAAGAWQQPATGASGTLTGVRIARLGGPRIRFVNPPAGSPGALVTVVGDSLGSLAADPIHFGASSARWIAASATRITTVVPAAAATGRIAVDTASGQALSPVEFSVEATSPHPSLSPDVATIDGGALALAVSPDGRKVYAAVQALDRSAAGGVAIVHAPTRKTLVFAPLPGAAPRSVALSPDGKRLYAAVPGIGVQVRDSALGGLRTTVPLPAIGAAIDNPQGLASSPDGRLLMVSDGTDGGRVTVFDTESWVEVAHVSMPMGVAPLGVAFHPSGDVAYVAAAQVGAAGGDELLVFDPMTGSVASRVSVGRQPTGVAVSPDGAAVFVSNQRSHTVSHYDTTSGAVVHAPVQLAPSGIAVSPDGQRVFVACRDSGTIDVLANSGFETGLRIDTGSGALAIALDPRGASAYVGNPNLAFLREIGGSQTLTVALAGSGIGRVTSAPAGIACGASCLARYPAGTLVTLTAIADSGSQFVGWGGDTDCSDGRVTIDAKKNCVAIFNSRTPAPGASGGPCFIATAAYGSEMAPQVQLLRDFRDRRLMTHRPGRAFVAFYYRHSPALAEWIRPSETRRALVRAALWPLVMVVGAPVESAFFSIAAIAFGFAALRSHRRPQDPPKESSRRD
jgi:DNA-binding beta-propeller fold protein YncE